MELDELKAAIEGYNRATADAMKAATAQISTLTDRLEELEARAATPGKIGDGTRESKEDREHRERFVRWLRRPEDHAAKTQLAEAESELTKKAVNTTSDAAGGFAVPKEIHTEIERRVSLLNPFRQLVTVRQIGTSDYHELVDLNNDGSGWVGESAGRTETDTSQLRDREPTLGTVYAYPKASEESLDDIFFDVGAWLTETAADSFAAAEATAIASGNGTNKPTGFLNTSPVTTADDASPLRDEDTLQYLAGLAGSPAALSADALIELATSGLKESYLMGDGVAWVMHRTALTQVRQLKDNSGRYVWAESLQPGVPGTLLGYPVWTTDAMETVSANNHPIAFGNWRRGYLLVDRVGMRITVDNNISTPGQVKFYLRRRVGGIIRNNDAIKVLKWAES